MAAMSRRPDALIAVVIMLVGWVASVGIRSWQHMEVDIVAEATGVALAVAVVYGKMSGRGDDGEDGQR